jgi:transcriptional regulator with XRE-family HTH domain
MRTSSDDADLTEEELVGENVNRLRLARGLRQDDLAAQLRSTLRGHPWTQAMLSDIEQGKRRVNFAETAALCRELDVDLNGLLEGDRDLRVAVTGGGVVALGTLRDSFAGQHPRYKFAAPDGAIPPPDSDAVDAKVARRLGVSPDVVKLQALHLWGMPLASVRDQRCRDLDEDLPASTLQAQRGHTTRALTRELRAHLDQEAQQ